MEKPKLITVALREADEALNGKRKKPQRSRASLPDAVYILQSPEWDCLAYNERTTELVFTKKPPCQTAHKKFPSAVMDADFTSIVSAFDSQDLTLSYESAVRAAVRAGTFRSFDPVRDYLDTLKWDGLDRLPWWLQSYFGAGVNPEDDEKAQTEEKTWNQEIGKRWMIAAVARVYDPGCQVDTILIAEGSQGVGKSSAFRALAVEDNWFACDLPDIRGKDAVHHVLGPWIIELDELDALNRREATSIKSYVSRRTDRARLSYGRLATNHPRRVVFCGTTNEDRYNTDATGGRRYWPFKVRGPIDVAGIVRDRDQLWAEAVKRYRQGERWHLDDRGLERIAKAEQDKRFKASPWLEAIEDYISKANGHVLAADILSHVLQIDISRQDQRAQNEVSRCLQHLGWKRVQKRLPPSKKRQWVWVPPLKETRDA